MIGLENWKSQLPSLTNYVRYVSAHHALYYICHVVTTEYVEDAIPQQQTILKREKNSAHFVVQFHTDTYLQLCRNEFLYQKQTLFYSLYISYIILTIYLTSSSGK